MDCEDPDWWKPDDRPDWMKWDMDAHYGIFLVSGVYALSMSSKSLTFLILGGSLIWWGILSRWTHKSDKKRQQDY